MNRRRYVVAFAPGIVALALAAACRGGGDYQEPAGPSNVIVFGARTAEGRYGLYSVRPDGTDLERLSGEQQFAFFPRWSPSGSRVAYIVRAEGDEGAGTLRVFDFETGSATTVSEQALPSDAGPAASWSPDGWRLAFAETSGGGRVRVYDVGRRELLDDSEIAGTTPDWSPTDEDALAFAAPAGDETDLRAAQPNGDDARTLLERPGIEGDPRWSPDGRFLAFWSAPVDGPPRLFVLEIESGDMRELAGGQGAAWSPEAARIAYTGPTAAGGGNREIYVVPAAGGATEALTQSVTVDTWPSWSPRGDAIAYLAIVDRQTSFLCVAQLDPRGGDCLNLPGLTPSAPAWSPR